MCCAAPVARRNSPGSPYRNGPAGLWPSVGVGILVICRLSRRVRNFGAVTVPDILATPYSQAAADAGNFSTTVAYLTIVSYQFKGGGNSHGP